MRAFRALAEFLVAGLAREGIQNPDFAILEALLHKGPLTLPALEQKVRLAAGPLKVAIARLRRRGVVREQPATDRRNAGGFELTEEGRTTITRTYARHTEDIETVMGVLTPGELRHLWQSLKKVGMRGERCQHTRSKDQRGGVAPWPLRRATEYMAEHLADTVPLKDLAGQTGLSPSRFRAHSSCPWASPLFGGR